jgi:hypothetical protein
MRWLVGFGRFWYDFLVGDDWTIAVAVVAAVAATALLAHNGATAWWLMPLAVAAILGLSVGRVAKQDRPRRSEPSPPRDID